ncbi:unnamed protein product [Cutaneotrichosporon oleaginosum]
MRLLAPVLLIWATLFSADTADAKSHVKIILTVPTLVQCEKATLHWKGGNSPFRVWAQEDSRNPDGISHIANSTQNRFAEWTVDAPAGTRVSLRLRDAKGHWVRTHAVVYAGADDACVNLAYPDPTEPAESAPPRPWRLTRGLEFLALAAAVLVACGGIVWALGGRRESEVRGEYAQVQSDEIPLSRAGVSRVSRRTPTREDEWEGEREMEREREEFRSLLPSNKRVD